MWVYEDRGQVEVPESRHARAAGWGLFCLQGLPHKVKNEVNEMLAHASIVLWADQLLVS
jgi:hypothetical protein